ncbi:hypothetical protein HHL22_00860 [Hymenobacter sp. RP-2-7]|uniref:Lipoprotein n=1 Tax=Hymenobacter polaris TaxID=2682546 RepID=A0A7Y0FKI7_9BACT|nr:hypothetical protein [Hymenobacter polaris]NML63747.1 hypothetical protein [Hymenobacter polaris]
MRSSISLLFLFAFSALLALGTAACGTKPDGTPYGVDPAKLPDGRRKTQEAAMSIYKKDMPKGAEMNAVTNGARAGQPASQALPDQPAR